jgi:hypothetical protein
LIDLAKSHVKAAAPKEEVVGDASIPAEGETVETTDSVTEPAPRQAEAAEKEGEKKPDENIVDPAVLATRKDRAERLLKAMGAR